MPQINLTDTEVKILADLLEMAHQEFSNHGCNDYPLENTDENWELIQNVDKNVCDEPTYESRPTDKKLYGTDWILMIYFQNKINGKIK